jgi:hypothetical protein
MFPNIGERIYERQIKINARRAKLTFEIADIAISSQRIYYAAFDEIGLLSLFKALSGTQ